MTTRKIFSRWILSSHPAPRSGEGNRALARWEGRAAETTRIGQDGTSACPLHHASHGPPPPLRCATRWRINDIVLATPMRPSFAGTTPKKPEPDPVMRRRRWDRLPPDHVQPNKNRTARRRKTHSLPSASFGMRSRPKGGRSPVGVPPRHLRQRTNATAQQQPRASWDPASSGVTCI